MTFCIATSSLVALTGRCDSRYRARPNSVRRWIETGTRIALASLYSLQVLGTVELRADQLLTSDELVGRAGPQKRFGKAIAISENWAVIGTDQSELSGAVFVYKKQSGDWVFHQEIRQPNGPNLYSGGYRFFGAAVSVADDFIAIGSPANPDAVYVFKVISDQWEHIQTLHSPRSGASTTTLKMFGTQISMSGALLVIGDPFPNENAIFLYSRSGDQYELVQSIERPSSDWTTSFGESLAIDSHGGLIIGAPTGIGSGMVHIFEKQAESWQEVAAFEPPSVSSENRNFGAKVSIDGDFAVASTGLNTVLLHTYRRNAEGWQWVSTLGPTESWWTGSYVGDAELFGGKLYIGGLNEVFTKTSVGQLTWGGENWIFDAWLSLDRVEFGNPYAGMGSTLALSADHLLASSAIAEIDGVESGAVASFARNLETWTANPVITAGVGNEFSKFGFSVALHGPNALVGEPSQPIDPANGEPKIHAGAAHFYVKTSEDWLKISTAEVPISINIYRFGASVAIHEVWAAVGNGDSAVFIYHLADGIWSYHSTINGPSGSLEFGEAIAINDRHLVIGQPSKNKTYFYSLINQTWTQVQQVTGPNARAFGTAIDLDGDRVVVGDPESFYVDENNLGRSGSVTVLNRVGGTWLHQVTLDVFMPSFASDGSLISSQNAAFGNSVSLDSDTLVVGAPAFNVYPGPWLQPISQVGAAFIFNLQGALDAPIQLSPDLTAELARYGSGVSIAGDRIAISSGNRTSIELGKWIAHNTGKLAIFERQSDVWTVTSEVTWPGVLPADYFGSASPFGSSGSAGSYSGSIDMSHNTLLIGAPGTDRQEADVGAAYLFDLDEVVQQLIFSDNFESTE